jgi:hypothetical protein
MEPRPEQTGVYEYREARVRELWWRVGVLRWRTGRARRFQGRDSSRIDLNDKHQFTSTDKTDRGRMSAVALQ